MFENSGFVQAVASPYAGVYEPDETDVLFDSDRTDRTFDIDMWIMNPSF